MSKGKGERKELAVGYTRRRAVVPFILPMAEIGRTIGREAAAIARRVVKGVEQRTEKRVGRLVKEFVGG